MTAVLLLLFTFAASGFADCTLGLSYSAQFRTTAYDIAISGDDIWLATGYGLQLLDRRSDPPRLVAYAAVPELTRNVRVRGNIAYAGSGSSIVVAQKNAGRIEVVRSIDAGATVQALLIEGNQLYVGTTNGLVAFDTTNPTVPARTNATFSTSLPGISSLAVRNGELYAADGDQTVEVFNIASATPVKSSTIASLPRSISVAISATTLLVSDGQQTDVFLLSAAAPQKVISAPFGSTTFATHTGAVHFVAGQDRRLMAVDFTSAGSPVSLYEVDAPVSGGSVNRITAIATTADRVYVAAGDSGLLTWDTSRFTSPYPLRAYASAPATSIASVDTAFFNGTGSGLVEFRRSSGTTLTPGRTWAAGNQVVHFATADGFLLTSSDKVTTYWTTRSTTPTAVSATTFRAAVGQATVLGSTMYALLADGSLWSASLQQATGTPVAISVAGGAQTSMARSGNGFALAQVSEAGTTTVRFYANGDFTAQPSVATIQGAATTPVALDGLRAAVFTFRGISVIEFGGVPVVTELPQSNQQIAVALAIHGNRLLELTSRELIVWDLTTRAIERRFTLPGDGLSLSILDATLAAVGTTSSTVAIAFGSTSQLPSPFSATTANSYYRKAVLTNDRLALLATGRIDLLTFAASRSPVFTGTIQSLGVIDVASSTAGIFTLAGSGAVTAWTPAGQQFATITFSEGSDAVPLAIHATSGAVFVSISKGCLTGGCEKKTIVLNARTLAITGSMTGAIVDLAEDGARGWVITDLPAEVRRLDLTDAARPSVRVTRTLEGNAASIAVSGSTVYTLGDRLYAYRDTDLGTVSQQFASNSMANPFVRTTGGCGMLSRGGTATVSDTANAVAWIGSTSLTLPAGVRSITSSGGRVVVLTDYSIEVYGGAVAKPPRRRPTR